jgi:hypothetical protein
MSIAALQRQLSASKIGDVALRTYFSDLCDTIGASMIGDHDQLSLSADVDDSVAAAEVSVSLGLIVTELVITPSSTPFRAIGQAKSWSNIIPAEPRGRCPSATRASACPRIVPASNPGSARGLSKRWPAIWAPRSGSRTLVQEQWFRSIAPEFWSIRRRAEIDY